MNKSSALRAEDVAAPEDGRTPANSSQNVTMLRDSTAKKCPDDAVKAWINGHWHDLSKFSNPPVTA